ncbi:MAG: hypothetical protein HYT94_05085 [Parcubacteria group bacterium]|nr:hypothetical protein [Parcubacteria group bacterium]
MYNWSTDENILKKDPLKHELWEFGQMANFGLNGRKFKEQYLRAHLVLIA